ncbi:MAG: cupin domain-containing protein [Pseudomonadota bacterium]
MEAQTVSMEEMQKRIARFDELRPTTQAYLDTLIPGHARDIYNLIGRGVTENPASQAAIAVAEGFNVTLVKAPPNNGAALHAHPTVEVFIPLSGKWAICWGDDGEREVVLGPWDVISVPSGVMRGFRNVGSEDHHLLAIVGGTDAGRVTWAPKVLAQAEKTGFALDESGDLIRR